jgi:protein-S-isoprenylcysteine O-methyltransferase Ste14
MIAQEKILRHRPPRIAIALVGIALLLHMVSSFAIHRALPFAAGVTGLLGLAMMLRAWWLFRVANTAICPTDNASMLITNDIYSLTRNPMYLGMTLMLISVGLYTGAMPFYLASMLNVAILQRHFVPYEEAKLRKQYGNTFRDYEKRVRRWL